MQYLNMDMDWIGEHAKEQTMEVKKSMMFGLRIDSFCLLHMHAEYHTVWRGKYTLSRKGETGWKFKKKTWKDVPSYQEWTNRSCYQLAVLQCLIHGLFHFLSGAACWHNASTFLLAGKINRLCISEIGWLKNEKSNNVHKSTGKLSNIEKCIFVVNYFEERPWQPIQSPNKGTKKKVKGYEERKFRSSLS